MFCMLKNIYPVYVSKHNSNCEKQVILLIIPNRKGCEQSKTLATQAKSEGRDATSEGCEAKSEERKAKFEGREAKFEGDDDGIILQ